MSGPFLCKLLMFWALFVKISFVLGPPLCRFLVLWALHGVFCSRPCLCRLFLCLGFLFVESCGVWAPGHRTIHEQSPDKEGNYTGKAQTQKESHRQGPEHIECSRRRPRPEKYVYEQGPDTKGVETIWAKTPNEFSHTRPRQKETYENNAQTKKESTQTWSRPRRKLHTEPRAQGIYTNKAQTSSQHKHV